MKALSADFKLGFLGAGQLARMSAQEAYKLGIQVVSYGSSEELEPLDLLTPHQFHGSFNDEEKLIEFAKECDIITLENEFLDSELLKRVSAKSGTPIYPSPESFELIESKLIEKETFKNAGIPVADFAVVKNNSEINAFGDRHDWPFILKSSKGGYDGYGNKIVGNSDEGLDAFKKLGGEKGQEILAEAFVPFDMELAVQVARNEQGVSVFPCCETVQTNHICTSVISPAQIDPSIQKQAQDLAIKAVEAINGKGIFAFEFFLTKTGNLVLNESAPRPHNSGHYSIEGCNYSQFAMHIRAVLGLPLPEITMNTEAAVMINLLGTHNRPAKAENIKGVLDENFGYLHLYGKAASKSGRKMGHFTLLGSDAEKIHTRALQITKKITI